jgi:hypothetical protein
MVRASGRVECCAKIAMTLLHSVTATMGLLLQAEGWKFIFPDA